MKAFRLMLILLLSTVCLQLRAQNDDFKAFRERMHSDFKQFRRNVLDDYDKYLAGVWEEFKTFRSERPDKKPKPAELPVCLDTPAEEPVELAPVPEPQPEQLPMASLVPSIGKVPDVAPMTFTPPAFTPLAVDPGISHYVSFTFCGVDQRLPEVSVPTVKGLATKNVASAWKILNQTDTKSLISSISACISAYGLNDWLTYLYVQTYVDALAPDKSSAERVLMTQFIMSHLGYDIRLAATDRQLILLIPFKETVYGHQYILNDNHTYCLYYDDIAPIEEGDDPKVFVCQLPKDSELGRELSLMVSSPVLIDSGEPHPFNISYEGITIHGSVDKNVMELFRHYPQTDIQVYAGSVISSDIRSQILSQISAKLNGLTELEKVNLLLHFTQSGFKYQTDQDQHGYEKFYFLEENLYYPKNDCEDRAIFFGYLVRNLLGITSQLLSYPEHESCAVNLTSPVSGDFYTYKGQRFIIADPCYIGADAGQCMPRYKQTGPKIDFSY